MENILEENTNDTTQIEVTDAENREINLLEYSPDDLGNGERLLAVHGRDIVFSTSHKRWFVWNGLYWKPDKNGEIFRRTVDVMKKLKQQAETAPVITKEIEQFVKSCGNNGRIHATIKSAENFKPISNDEMNTNENLMTCLNGTIDLLNCEFKEAKREDYISMIANVKYDPNATCPQFLEFINYIFENDTEMVSYVQRALGYSMTSSIKEQCFFLCIGGGANGKSTLFDIMAYIFNDYCDYISMGAVLDGKSKGNGPNPELAKVQGKRLVFATESKDSSKLNETLMKNQTGGEKVYARFLHANGDTYKPTYKIWLGSNYKLDINGMDYGIWRRVKLIPFNVKIEKPDKDFVEKLKTEATGIFNWLIEGSKEYFRIGLKEPQTMINAINEYKEEMDLLLDFLTVCTVSKFGKTIRATALYEVYEAYTKNTKETPMSQKAFGKNMAGRGYKKKRDKKGFYYENIEFADHGYKFSSDVFA